MRAGRWFIGLFLLLGAGNLHAATGQWKVYTSQREIRDLALDPTRSNTFWAVTSGGMFSYRTGDNTFTLYTPAEGLRTIDLTAVAVDKHGAIWIGAANGILHRFSPSGNDWTYVTDIFLRTDPNKRINSLRPTGDTLYILSDLGVSVFFIPGMEFRETYSHFGSGAQSIVGSAVDLCLYHGQIWVATRNGIASTSITNPNPSTPESWQIFTTLQGLPSAAVNRLAVSGDSLFAGTEQGMAVFNGATWSAIPGTSGSSIVDLQPGTAGINAGSALSFITSSQKFLYRNGTITPSVPAVPSGTTLQRMGTETVLASQSRGLFLQQDTSWVNILAPGPYSNKFVGLAIDRRGVLWSGTGSANGDGFMSFDGKGWRVYTAEQDPRLINDNYYKISIGAGNAKWVSNWGAGIALLDDRGTLRRVFNVSNGLPPTLPSSVDPTYIVVGGVATDHEGVTWITNRTAPADTALSKFLPDSSFSYVRGLSPRTDGVRFTDVLIDNNETKWFANTGRFEPDAPVGLFYYNERQPIEGLDNNGWGEMTADDGLTSNKVWSLALDNDGQLWIGSDQGITIIYDPTFPRERVAAYHPLPDQTIQAMVVDAVNNKWVATKQGVFVLSSDGTSILERFTSENTNGKLIDNDVASLVINNTTGVVYCGTERGLSTLTTASISPNLGFDNLHVSPNPFYLPANIPLTVDGLVAGSSIKVLTIDGKLVREIPTAGGRVGYWDGKNTSGNLVATAVYLVVAYSEDGSKVATGKVAVIRR